MNPPGIQVGSRFCLLESTYPFPEACSSKLGLDIFPFSASQYTLLFQCLANLSLQRLDLYFTCTFNNVKQSWWAVWWTRLRTARCHSMAITSFCSPETLHVGQHFYPKTNKLLSSGITHLSWVREADSSHHSWWSATLFEELVGFLVRWLMGQHLKIDHDHISSGPFQFSEHNPPLSFVTKYHLRLINLPTFPLGMYFTSRLCITCRT
jgi:hypothetical protein